MRLSRHGLDGEEREQLQKFAELLLDIGVGTIPSIEAHGDQEGETINVPNDLLSLPSEDPINAIVSAVYPDFENNYQSRDQVALYSPEFLNSLKFPGIANHVLSLKVNFVIMLLRNISPSEGLCNGSRLLIMQLCPNVIEAKIVAGTNINIEFSY
ncbi:DNA helicase PIF1, ATP-dependent [Corchorus olitorius]|uniref:DNA helicase PIF1, ATP-dependent n=1 Tax=Corchorus olitorius TaxID=93759 RepID=A0A1R3HLQ0_9ROSI|nr:DNA helicase PIF1, ATP-dependent [Corchorus olitorius]